jgi:ectoine hydroxylase-related dioxygenase (phytanoyl-CoA dioxygenase family)
MGDAMSGHPSERDAMPETLTQAQIDHYERTGYLILDKRIPDDVMNSVRGEIARLCAPARGMTASDDRLDLEDSHTPASPRVRRVKLPHKQSKLFDQLMRSDWILAPVRDLIGPDLRLHTAKLNMKSAGYGAAVEWHQDWAFYPQTNDDVLAVGVLIDDMGAENGPLQVIPGTHRDPVYDHHHDGFFAGAVDMEKAGIDMARAVPLMGGAGSVTIHHARLLHGSALNTSASDRRILFYEMMAADAVPIAGSAGAAMTWEELEARMLCGKQTNEPRLKEVPVRLPYPQPPTTGSIYEVQKAMGRRSFGVAEPAAS